MKPQQLQGVVTPFKGNGRKLGYPTANIKVETDLTDGVYFGYASIGVLKGRPALIFIGVPTTMGDQERRVEVHVLDIPDRDYYGELLVVELRYYHRPNQTFESVDELLAVMKNDESTGRAWVAKNPLAIAEELGDT